jgi:SAM-dependent methyltransferase
VISFHEAKGLLGVGDLHPGGVVATERILAWIAEARSVIEIGAGIGRTTTRLLDRGLEVTALEPNPRLHAQLVATVRSARRDRCEEFRPSAPVDAVVAESVLYMLDLPRILPHVRAWLREGGVVAHSDMVWAPGTPAHVARALYDETLERHGIAVASREPWTWDDWIRMFDAAGFALAHAERLASSPRDARPSVASMVRHPLAVLSLARQRASRPALDPNLFESWVACWRAV